MVGPNAEMKNPGTIFLILFLSALSHVAQNPLCSNGYVYMDGGSFISYYDPTQPLSAVNPSNTNIPTFGGGLTLMPNINGGTLSPTFYSVFNGDYYYWSGTAWQNTGHSVGSNSAVNLAGCGGKIYNLVGGSGDVYTYDGTGNGTYLTTLANFNGGGPFDLVTDCNCNFYALNTTNPNQSLTIYDPSGNPQCTYSLSGMPNTSAGGGFAIIGNMIYVKNNTTAGFYIGTISGTGVTFTAVSGFTNSPGDFASCPVCNSAVSLTGISLSSGTLNCTFTVTSIAASSTATSLSYNWTGPGIVGSSTTAAISVNAAGVYTCLVITSSCPPTQGTFTTTVVNNSVNVVAALTPSGNVCVGMNTGKLLTVTHSSTNEIVFWNGPSTPSVTGTSTVNVALPGTYTVKVTDPASGCSKSSTVLINTTPTVNLALSSNSLCYYNYNGSPNSITLTPSGATNYTLLTSSNYSTSSPNGTIMPISPSTLSGNLPPLATGTLIGSTGACGDTTQLNFTIIDNPNIGLSQLSGSICPGNSLPLFVVGATLYNWGGSLSLNTYTGSNVVATPTGNSTYTVLGTDQGCKSITQTVNVVVLPLPTLSVTPTNTTICLGSTITLVASGTANSFTWGPNFGLLTSANGASISVMPPTNMYYSVTGSLNSCTAIATCDITVVQPPVLGLSLTNYSMCSRNYNNSPNTISLTPSGASNYSLAGGPQLIITFPNGPVMEAVPSGTAIFGPAVITVTLFGNTGVCTTSITHTILVVPNPVLTVSPLSASICPGQSQSFSVSGATTYTWLPMPNFTVTGNNSMVANPILTSFYPVTGSENGCRSQSRNAVLLVLPVPDIFVPPNYTVCAGNSLTLSATGTGSVYSWTPSTTLLNAAGTEVLTTPGALQTYTVKTSLNTCTSQAVTTVSVIVMPVIHATTSQSVICSNSGTHLNVTGANSFFWYPTESLNYASGSSVYASPGESTTYTVHGFNGICTGSTTIRVQTVKRPDLEFTTTANQICAGSSLPISVKGAQTYTWLPADLVYVSGTNTTVTAFPPVSTNYTVIGANSIGSVSCFHQISYSVVVMPSVQPVISDKVTICLGQKTTLFSSGGNTYSWSPAEGLNFTDASRVVASPRSTTIYTVDISHNTFCGKSTTVMVVVNPVPEVYAGRDTSYNINDQIFIHATGTGTLTWMKGEGITCLDCPITQIHPTRSGCYNVLAINDEGCTVEDDICIELTEEFTIYVPNSFSPNNDGINEEFLIFGENISEISMEIYDRWGIRLFYSEEFHKGWDGKFKDVACPVGTYTYIIKYKGANRKNYTRTGNVNIIR
ncbi:hypothetical protein CNR22_21230 [Sphingobacteriaceae bacterium]|nr:hypothetical protein CNR22_21230 [Sphingobacteriaceae bacterium]